MLTFEGKPKFLEKFRVVGYQATQAFGEIGMLSVSLRPLKFRTELELETHVELQEMLGEALECKIGEWKFAGTVESVETRTHENFFWLILRDPLAKLDKVFMSRVFTDQTLGDIASEVIPSNLDFQFLGGCDSYKLRLAVQFRESSFAFLKRLLHGVGGQIWCSGGVIYLGTAPLEETVTMRLGRDISDFTIETGLGPEKVGVDSIPYIDKNTVQRTDVELTSKKWGDVQAAVIDLRKKHDETRSIHIVHEDAGYEDTGQMAHRLLRSQASGRFRLAGQLKVPVSLGATLKIENTHEGDSGGNVLTEETVVTYVVGGNSGETTDTWGIVAENPESMLDPKDVTPDRLITSTAIVEDADDPQKMNRVRVYFPWDVTQNSTPWLRVATPSWGADHAHYIPPKIGDTVLVSWGQRDMDPVVMGSVPAGDELDLSSETMVLKTVEGHTVTVGKNNIKIVNEAEGGGTELEILPDQVVVNTKKGQSVTIGSDSLKLENGANCSIEIQSSKIVISASEVEISTAAGASVKLSGPQVSINNGALEVV